MFRHLALAAAIGGLLASPALAQDGSTVAGIAVAQAAEAGLGVCLGADAAETMGCARTECMAQSGLGEDECAVNLWCFPHGWTAQVAVLHKEGLHWTKVFCDQMDRAELDRTVAAYCDNALFMECSAVRIWDRDGTAVLDYPAQ